MADQFNPTLEYLDYPVLDRGMNTILPNRSMVPGSDGPLFKLVQNMVGHHGLLGSWFGVFPLSEFETNGYPTIRRDGSYFETAPDGLLNGQTVMWQFWDFPQTWNNATPTTQSTYGKFMGIVVTSREIHVYSPQDHVWYNATPVYTGEAAGATVDVSVAGLVTVNAGASPWLARKIVPGQLIQFAGDATWYSISSVADLPDELQTNFAGVAKVNVAYTIRRCFGGRNYSHGDNLLYGTVFNGDLYIAGRTLAGAGVGPAAIRVANIYDNVYVTEYLLAGFDLTGSMSTNGSVIADLWDIKGLQILPDGRVVLATAEIPPASATSVAMTGIVGNRLRYSSNIATGTVAAGTLVTAQEIWNASPAGFIDVVDHAGEITALGKLGPSTLTIHFHRGISLGTYTAQYDPPLAIQASSAKVGCLAPRTLTLYRGKELFLGADGLVHAFDGVDTKEISDETIEFRHAETNNQLSFAIANTHAVVDTRRDHYRLFFCDNNFEEVTSPPAAYADYAINTVCWVVDLVNPGNVYQETYGPHVTSAAFPAVGLKAATTTPYVPSSVGGNFGAIILGINSAPPSAVAGDIVGGHFLYGMGAIDGNLAGNQVWYNASYADVSSHLLETDFLDMGKPGVDKTISHLLIWFQQSSTNFATIPTVVAYANGTTYTAQGPTLFQFTDETPLMFDFEPFAAENVRFSISRVLLHSDAVARGLAVRRMRIYYQTQGEIEASNPDL